MIKQLTSKNEFDSLTESWRTLAVETFGPLADLDSDEIDAEVMIIDRDGDAVAYLISERQELWHIEVREDARGNGYARRLCEAAKIRFAWEVCSDEGAALCESLGIDFDDCR